MNMEFNVGDLVYVKKDIPRAYLGHLHEAFTSVASDVVEINGEMLTLSLYLYTTAVPSKYCLRYEQTIFRNE